MFDFHLFTCTHTGHNVYGRWFFLVVFMFVGTVCLGFVCFFGGRFLIVQLTGMNSKTMLEEEPETKQDTHA